MIYTHVAAVVGGLAIGFAGAWNVQNWRHDSKELARQEIARESQRMRARAADSASERHEADKASLLDEFKPIHVEVEHVVEKPVYRNVCLDADGLQLLERAIRGPATSGEPAPAVPRSQPSR